MLLDACPSELLVRVFTRLHMADLLMCMRVSRRFHEVGRHFTDWEMEWKRLRVDCAGDDLWFGRQQSMGRELEDDDLEKEKKDNDKENNSWNSMDRKEDNKEKMNQLNMDAMAELVRAVAMEQELRWLCAANIDPTPPPTDQRTYMTPWLHSSTFDGAHLLSRLKPDVCQGLVDPRRDTWKLERVFEFDDELESALSTMFLPGGQQVLDIREDEESGDVTFYRFDVLNDKMPLSKSVFPFTEGRWLVLFVDSFVWEDTLCVLLSESFGPYPDQNRLRGFVFKLPDLQLVLHKQLDSTQHIFPWGQRHRSPFFFLRSENPLTAVDIRTLEPFCEFPLRGQPKDGGHYLSPDLQHLLVQADGWLHVFDVPTPGPSFVNQPARAVLQLKPTWHYAVIRDEHVLTFTTNQLTVSDLDLTPLWCLDNYTGGGAGVCFVGADLLVTAQGLVYDWRREKRYMGLVDYCVPLRLNKRPGAPCAHVYYNDRGPCLACAGDRSLGRTKQEDEARYQAYEIQFVEQPVRRRKLRQ